MVSLFSFSIMFSLLLFILERRSKSFASFWGEGSRLSRLGEMSSVKVMLLEAVIS